MSPVDPMDMVCLSCAAPTRGRLCDRCSRSLRPAPERLLPGGIRLVAAFEHSGPARVLVHHLKYKGVTSVADLVAEVVAHRAPRLPVVPVPRALSRRLKYGIDPAREVAGALARRIGVPVVDALVPRIHTPRRAGGNHSRSVPPFHTRSSLRSPVIVVDDVITTGTTVLAAVAALGPDVARAVVAANVVAGVSNVAAVVTSPEPGVDRVWQPF